MTVTAEVAFEAQPDLSREGLRQRLKDDLERFKRLVEDRAGDGRFTRAPKPVPRETS